MIILIVILKLILFDSLRVQSFVQRFENSYTSFYFLLLQTAIFFVSYGTNYYIEVTDMQMHIEPPCLSYKILLY